MAITPHVESLTGLKTYIKERLGHPIVNIEVTDEQLKHCINQTIEKFVEFSESGTQLRFQTLDTVVGTNEYTMTNDVYTIYELYDTTATNGFQGVFPDKVVADIFGSQLVTASKGDLLTLDLTRAYLKDVEFLLTVKLNFDFNAVTKKLFLLETPTEITKLGIAFYQKIDYSDESSQIYDHQWIKNYSTATTKKQWASNLLKWAGTMLPGGLQMNADSILQEANTEIEKLEEELNEVWRMPTDFFIG